MKSLGVGFCLERVCCNFDTSLCQRRYQSKIALSIFKTGLVYYLDFVTGGNPLVTEVLNTEIILQTSIH